MVAMHGRFMLFVNATKKYRRHLSKLFSSLLSIAADNCGPTFFHVMWNWKKFVTRISDNFVAEISREDLRLGDLAAIVLEYSSQQENPTHSLFNLLNSYLQRRQQS
jgi:hypothetical protein